MSEITIKVENLGKKYILGQSNNQNESYTALRDVIARGVKNITRKKIISKNNEIIRQDEKAEEFWALKDINFEIKQGECVGIIGRNGAGKSTLLKVLSRITEPSKGRVTINGRVASLLEVGTGFHPELSGRENIYLNGAILGMSRNEIKMKFDEIVEFSEVNKFLDTPVKKYSSGMYVRLAFAVAAHLEPEVLVIDEVLAVGDHEFQKKCLGKMNDVAKSGRTVLFVSHNMAAVQRLCPNAILLGSGKLIKSGNTKELINDYLSIFENDIGKIKVSELKRTGNNFAKIIDFNLIDYAGQKTNSICSGDEITIALDYIVDKDTNLTNLSIGVSLHDKFGDTLSILYSSYCGLYINSEPGKHRSTLRIKKFPFSKGEYFFGARLVSNGVEIDWPKELIGKINVEPGDYYESGELNFDSVGPIMLDGKWSSI